MARKTPNVYERSLQDGSKRYDVMLTFRDPHSNRRIQKMRTFRTRKEALDALAQNRTDNAQGDTAPPLKMTVAELASLFLTSHRAHVKPTTFERYESAIMRHVVPALGHIRLTDLTALRLEQHYGTLAGQGLGAPIVAYTHARIVQMFEWARERKLVKHNEPANAKAPRPRRIPRPVWSDEQIASFLTHAEQAQYGPLWLLGLHTGLRRGELLGLRWRHVDLDRADLAVRNNRVLVRGRLQDETPKGGRIRTIALSPQAVAALRQQKARQAQWRLKAGAAWPSDDYVFTTQQGHSPYPSYLGQELHRLCALAGLPQGRIHDMRHAHASWLLRHGVNYKEVSETLGHASTSMTMNIYAHVLPEEHRRTAALLGREMPL